MRFLGILDDNDEIVISKLENHKKAIEKQFEDEIWLQKAEDIVGNGGKDDFIILKDEENT